MTTGTLHDMSSVAGGIAARLRDAGMLLLTCDTTGAVTDPGFPGDDWLRDLVCRSGLVKAALRDAAAVDVGVHGRGRPLQDAAARKPLEELEGELHHINCNIAANLKLQHVAVPQTLADLSQ